MKYCLPLLFLVALAACQKQNGTDTSANIPVAIMNVPYGSDPQQKMDIYLPAGRNVHATKVMIMIHGGGWTEGDKGDFTSFVSVVQNMLPDYAIFNINYRLAAGSANLFPTQETDVKDAIGFIHSKRNDYYISDKFVYLGASAGGHLALLQAYKYATPVKPKAVVSFFGPTDLTALANTNIFAAIILAQVVGALPADNPALYRESSPLTYAEAASPPTLLLHGGLDPLVPPAQSEALQTALTTAGVANQYVFYPNEQHGWVGPNLDDSFNKIVSFLTTHVN